MQLIIISGLAGAGKSTALRILEDSGYYCIDNLPPPFLMQLLELSSRSAMVSQIAVSIDTRSRELLPRLPDLLHEASSLGIEVKFIYLDAQAEVLVKRFSETRRKHPLSDGKKTILDCIHEEREELAAIAQIAHHIDTTNLSANNLKALVKQFVNADYSQLNIVLQSFGFKYGLPIDSDFVFDVRCLPNPYYNKSISQYTGLEQPIIDYLQQQPKVSLMIDDIYRFMSRWLGEFSLDNRTYITFSVGCTGGMHRSVYIVEELAKLINVLGYKTLIRHRQIAQ